MNPAYAPPVRDGDEYVPRRALPATNEWPTLSSLAVCFRSKTK
jgi:hypothetical protein